MNNKAQISFEYLMTYGWILIVILVSIATLSYFGVLNMSSLMPERTMFAAPVPNIDNAVLSVSGHSVEVAFKNDKGVAIQIPNATNISVAECQSPASINSVTKSDGSPVQLGVDQIASGQTFRIKWDCMPNSDAKPGSRFNSDSFEFYYRNADTGQVFSQFGSIDGKWGN